MLFTSKSNTNTTTNTTATETTETTNNNGGLLKGLAIGVGTLAGIGAAYFGHKVYKSHHVVADENNLEDVNVDDGEGCENVTENNETVESFNEVETEETNESAPVEAETEETDDETQAEVKKVVDEKQATTKTSGETKTEVKMSIEEEVAREKLEEKMNILKRLQTADYADADKMLMLAISMVDYSIGTLRVLKVSDISEIETIANRNASLALDKYLSKRVKDINSVTAETHKTLIVITAELMTVKGVCDKCEELHIYSKTRVRLEKTLELSKKRDKHLFQKKVKEAMKTRVVDETQATTKESPSETKIGNSEVLSDDGETVTLKASVSEDSVQNVMDVIDIVSKIPNREDPEKNNMPYYIRVIGGRIAGITEPEATFLAYNDKTKSNDFIDACVSLCNMVGNGICNLADQKSDPIGSLGWINRSYDELIASGVIDNTYNPQAMRDVLTKARNEATRVLTNMVKKSDETQADDNKVTGETKTVTNGKLIDEINTYVHTINVMAFKQFTMVSTNSFVEKLHKIDECISLLDNSEPSKAIKRNAYKNINITVRLFCTSKLEEIDACANHNDIVDLCADVRAMLSLNLTNVELSETTLNAINNAITSAKDKKDKVDEIVAKNETQDLAKASGETKTDANSSGETKTEETLTYTMSDKIKEAVQQSDETAATAEPESKAHVLMSPEASEMARKLQEAGELIRAKKWSDASEFYKTQLTPYLADDGLTEELREEIMSIKTKATNMMMSQKQLEAKQKAASAKASKRKSSKRRRH
nr:MAG TPA: hypothetical protein [Caudoviricetes sp.]